MQYFLTFLEGIITFVSPCIFPMLPIYVAYFAGEDNSNKNKALKNSIGFVLGFTIIFVLMGAFAGTIGHLLNQYKSIVNIGTGLIVLMLGLHFLGIFKVNIFRTNKQICHFQSLGFGSAILFGIVFSISWTPCVGTFLGSALMLASERASILQGTIMLLTYSFGLGIPYIISAILIEKIKGAFQIIKNHYNIINRASGIFLIIIGFLIMTGNMGDILSLLSF